MKEEIEEILSCAKESYKESVKIENQTIEDNLLTIIANSKYIMKQLEKETHTVRDFHEDLESNEIEKVKRKVPLWLERKHQYTYKILSAYMNLSENGKQSIFLSLLEKNSDIEESVKFRSHYNQMKNISEKNHGKVFDEINGEVFLWEPVKDFIIEQFR